MVEPLARTDVLEAERRAWEAFVRHKSTPLLGRYTRADLRARRREGDRLLAAWLVLRRELEGWGRG